MDKILVIVAALLLLIISPVAFAKNCKKGQPCGNSCISWSKTCRIGTSVKAAEMPKSTNQSQVSKSFSSTSIQETSMSVKKYGLYEVTAVKLNVRNRPDENSEILGHLTKGTRIKVYSFTSDWALIMYSENLNWVSADYLVLVSKD